MRSLYTAVDPTRRLIEHDYWHRAPRADDSFASTVPANDFWRDYAAADLARPFLSPAVAQASGSLLEMLFALSVLDLPFAAGEHVADLRVLRPGAARARADEGSSRLWLVRGAGARALPAGRDHEGDGVGLLWVPARHRRGVCALCAPVVGAQVKRVGAPRFRLR